MARQYFVVTHTENVRSGKGRIWYAHGLRQDIVIADDPSGAWVLFHAKNAERVAIELNFNQPMRRWHVAVRPATVRA